MVSVVAADADDLGGPAGRQPCQSARGAAGPGGPRFGMERVALEGIAGNFPEAFPVLEHGVEDAPLVPQAGEPDDAGHRRRYFARSRYFPSAVSTRTSSPTSMNCGTMTWSPVSSTAGLPLFDAVAPFIPGAVSTTRRSTVIGSSTPTGRCSWNSTMN